MALPIEDYALIGDRGTAALVGKDGSIDWLCLPRFDSPACFAALLGTPDHGRWLIAPVALHDDSVDDPDRVQVSRRYVGATTILETTFTLPDGEVVLLDLMPTGDGRADVVRRVRCTRGRVRMQHDWVVRFDYGRIIPWVSREKVARSEGAGPDGTDEEIIVAVAGPDKVILRGPRLPVAGTGDRRHHSDEFEVVEGDEMDFTATWVQSWEDVPHPLGVDDRIEATRQEHEEWAALCSSGFEHADLVQRSLLTLRMMTHDETGGIVAAPTTSLPEDFGGERNWDYRFCWLRDAALTLESLLEAGFEDEARKWRDWLLRAVAGDPHDMQIMYTVDGGRQLP